MRGQARALCIDTNTASLAVPDGKAQDSCPTAASDTLSAGGAGVRRRGRYEVNQQHQLAMCVAVRRHHAFSGAPSKSFLALEIAVCASLQYTLRPDHPAFPRRQFALLKYCSDSAPAGGCAASALKFPDPFLQLCNKQYDAGQLVGRRIRPGSSCVEQAATLEVRAAPAAAMCKLKLPACVTCHVALHFYHAFE
jgi:hypothetical protein